MLTLLLTSMLTLAFNIQPVRAEPKTWYVDDDGPADFNLIQETINAANQGDTIFVKTGTYLENVFVNKNNLTLTGENKEATIIDGGGVGHVVRVQANSVIIDSFTIRNGNDGIFLDGSDDTTIIGNSIFYNQYAGILLGWGSNGNAIFANSITSNSYAGIDMRQSFNNTIWSNYISNGNKGIVIMDSDNSCNIVSSNTLFNNTYSLYLAASSGIAFYHNNFFKKDTQVIAGYANIWDDGYPSGGNYWSDYNGTDLYCGPYQNEAGSDGIGDIPYKIDPWVHDRYPLMNPWTQPQHDLVTSLLTPRFVRLGSSTSLNAILRNGGLSDEINLEFLLIINGSIVDSRTVPLLKVGSSYVLSYIWTPSVDGVYNVTAHAVSLPTETFISNNQKTTLVIVAPAIHVPEHFQTIQEAVDAATSGDSILVSAGTYFEHVRIVKESLTLIGESIENTIIDGNGTGTAVTMWHAPDVTINGFTIQNSGAGIYLDTSPYNNITGNTISNNLNGITLSFSHDAILLGNTVINNTSCGIILDFSAGSTLRSNSISNNRYNLVVESPGSYAWSISEWIYDIDTSNTVDGKPVYYWVNRNDTQIPDNAGYIAVINSTRIIVENVTLTNNGQGILFFYTSDSTIANATITNNQHGIVLSYSWNNKIMQNKITNSGGEGIELVVSHFNTIENNSVLDNGLKGIVVFEGSTSNNIIENVIANNAGGVSIEGGSGNNIVENIITNSSGVFIMGSGDNIIKNTIINNNVGNGIFMWPGSDSNITGNIIMNSEYGIYLGGGSQNNKIYENSIINNKFGIYMAHINNIVYHNNFVNNEKQAYNHYLGFKNTWDDGYPSGGNYWSDYAGVDLFTGSYQNMTGSDGIGDTPNTIDENNVDDYPLMTPWIAASPGDINRDGEVDMKDVATAAMAFGSYAGHPRWNPVADENRDGKIDLRDIALVAKNFGKTYP